MPDNIEIIKEGRYYHIYNRGINSCNLFNEEGDYLHFLTLYEKFIDPVAITYAWVLMPNHFHCLVYIKEGLVYKYTMEDIARFTTDDKLEINKWETIPFQPKPKPKLKPKPKPDSVNDLSALKEKEKEKEKEKYLLEHKVPDPTKHFSHLFNSYSKYYNAKYIRHGTLFERRFKRKVINSEDYLKRCIIYIHNNPSHHKFVSHPLEYSWSSYFDYLSEENETMKECVEKLFGDIANFKYCHKHSNNDFEWE